MNIEERKQFAKQLKIANEMIYSNSPTSQQLEFFTKVIEQYDYTQLVSALNQHCQRSKFAPKPADLIEIIDGGTDKLKAEALVAWGKAWEAVKRGPSFGMCFDDWRINSTIERMGGWVWFSSIDGENLIQDRSDRQKAFLATYPSVKREDCASGFLEGLYGLNSNGLPINPAFYDSATNANYAIEIAPESVALRIPRPLVVAGGNKLMLAWHDNHNGLKQLPNEAGHIEQVKLLEAKQ